MSSVAFEFERVVSGISRLLGNENLNKRVFAAQRRFPCLPERVRELVVARSRAQLAQMEQVALEIQEFERLSVICQYHGLRPVDSEVFSRLGQDVAWEIIDFQLNQVYRSRLVFKLGNYSVEEYETHTPWELFHRPRSIIPTLMDITQSMENATHLMPLDHIGTYVIEEALSEERAQFQIAHDFVCPLVDKETGENRAFISAFKIHELRSSQKVALLG